MYGFEFSRIIIIESLPKEEFASGEELQNYLTALNEDNTGIPSVELVQISNAEEFRTLIGELILIAQENNDIPILHIETHGDEDASGIVFSDNSELGWNELRVLLGPLNVATKMNLVICVAACFGGHFVTELLLGQTAPCIMLIGPSSYTNGPELLGRFRDFYRELFKTLDVLEAFSALNETELHEGEFLCVTATEWFHRVTVGYVKRYCSKAMLENRARNVHDQIIAEGKSVSIIDVQEIGFARVKEIADDYAETFFALQLVEGARDRFSSEIEKVKNQLTEFIQMEGY
ncbi:hypothetical protein [Undibacterium pigrum]|uniref:CHAT domain-containing protein n=1 Tax=Undibacterium pigrum TaxID=401470 RepID=A0A318JEK4_9BURK|nr:hypothetical protein [Undibacterium pigrum]PXX45223.1 hypothetical protein DFR42_102451 [Undibacterium pigrum]